MRTERNSERDIVPITPPPPKSRRAITSPLPLRLNSSLRIEPALHVVRQEPPLLRALCVFAVNPFASTCATTADSVGTPHSHSPHNASPALKNPRRTSD